MLLKLKALFAKLLRMPLKILQPLLVSTIAKLKLSEFIVFAVLIYTGFMVSDWIAGALGLAGWGLAGTLIILILPVAIIYYVWKQWLQKAAD